MRGSSQVEPAHDGTLIVIPAKAGIQLHRAKLDLRLSSGDELKRALQNWLVVFAGM
jgi:hypothetical protein